MTIRIAVIGAGIMGADHARIVAQDLPRATLQVVCDTDADRAKSVAQEYAAVDCTTNPEDTIFRDDVDAVIIASPDTTHAPLSLACISARKRALCEKPLSHTSDDCLAVMRAEQDAGAKFIQIGFMRRYDRSYIDMRNTLASGGLGRPLMMHNFHRNVSTPATSFTGAMAITSSAPHEFDMIRHVLGAECTSIAAFQPRRSDDVVAPVVMVLETSDGQLVTVEINNNAVYGYDVRAELVGEAGSLSINTVAHSRIDRALSQFTQYDADWRGRFADAYRLQNRDFVRFAETGEFPAVASTAWDGYCAALIAETGVRALATGTKQAIDMIARPQFYV